MKSVFPSATETILRPRIARRNPRATVSTSGSSGIRIENLQNSTALRPTLASEQSGLKQLGNFIAELSRKKKANWLKSWLQGRSMLRPDKENRASATSCDSSDTPDAPESRPDSSSA